MTTALAPRPAAIAAVLAKASTWTHGTRKSDGKPFYYIPGNTPGSVYMTATDGCTCPSAQNRPGPCKHSLAIREHQAPPKKSYAELYPVCKVNGCDEDAGRSGRCMDHARRLLAND